jgi:hypothetical protein
MSTLQLQRNSEVFYSSVDLLSSAATDMTPSNTWKLDILSGFALSADAVTRDIQHTQHGTTVDRSRYVYTTARNPVNWNFTTYLRCTGAERNAVPGGLTQYTNASGNAKPTADWFLWQALISNTAPAAAGEQSVWGSQGRLSTAASDSGTGKHASNSSSLVRPEGILYFKLDNTIYRVANAIVDSATLTAGIEEIVTVDWNGKGTSLLELQGEARDSAISVFGGVLNSGATAVANANAATLSLAQAYHPYARMNVAGVISTAPYLKNRLSAIELYYNANSYAFPVTAFSLEYKNDIGYIDRDRLGTVNNVVTGYSTSRSISGSLSMYLRGGDNASAQFLREISSSADLSTANSASATIYIGGTTAPYVSAYMPAVHFSYPVISTEDIINLSTSFTAQETYPRGCDELTLVATRFGAAISAFTTGIWVDSGFWGDTGVWSD